MTLHRPAGSPADSGAPPASRMLLAEASLLSVAIIWGVNIPLMKTALALSRDGVTMHPYAFNAIRLVISAAVLVLFAAREFRSGVRPAAGISWSRVVVYAVIVSGAYQLLFMLAVSRATSADISLIMATVPMWTALAARVFLNEQLARQAWIGLWIAFAGTMIVTLQRPQVSATSNRQDVLHGHSPMAAAGPGAADPESSGGDVRTLTVTTENVEESSRRLTGNLLSLVAALAWAGGTVFSRPLLRSISPTQLSACSTTIGLPVHVLLSWPVLSESLPLLTMVPMQLSLLYSGVLSTGLALALWSFGVQVAGSAQAAVFQNLTPIFAISAAWLWRGEPVSAGQWIGGSMIIGGLILMRRSRVSSDEPDSRPAGPPHDVNHDQTINRTATAAPVVVVATDTALPGTAAGNADV